ncbi:MAG: UDP-2,3-diacylglucosamine diphosphatase LpxI, partial [Planctomycetota bacterium]
MSSRDTKSAPVGLVAGGGMLPLCFARGAHKHGVRVVAVAIKDEADPELEEEVDDIHWTGLARLGQWIRIFRRAGVDRAVLCGNITKTRMFDGWGGWSHLPDFRSARLWFSKLRSHEDHTILDGVVEEFESSGITIESSILYCRELLAREGCLTRRRPTEEEWKDIKFAWPRARRLAEMQIGQSMVVKDGTVVAVEGIDGTDATLRRGGRLTESGAVAVKLARPDHDERFDIPCVGPTTIEAMAEGGIDTLAVQADNVLLLNRDETRRKADRADIS